MGFETTKRPSRLDSMRVTVGSQVAATTAFPTRGVWGVTSTSTDETPLVHTLNPPGIGDVLEVAVESLATSSSPIHINAGSSVIFDDATTAGSTASADMITLSSAGAGFRVVASSSGRWFLIGMTGVALSSST